MRREDDHHKMNPSDDCDDKHDDDGAQKLMQTEMVLHFSSPSGSERARQAPLNPQGQLMVLFCRPTS